MFFSNHSTFKIIRQGGSFLLAVLLICGIAAGCAAKDTEETASVPIPSSREEVSSEDQTVSEPESSEEVSSEEVSSVESVAQSSIASSSVRQSTTKQNTTSSTQSKPAAPPVPSAEYHYNTNMSIEDNVFMDALVYTGYNITKHRKDGNMWVYILAKQKRGLGYLSKITYGGGCMGYETKNGKPDIAAFQRGGLVCASYVTYVYFNYLPNVAGIDTSSLTTPGNSHMAHDWYLAAKDWVKKGYSKYIPFTASLSGNRTVFKSSQSIPIGSIIMFKDFSQRNNPKNDHGTHVCVYAGYKNGYNWVFHVGNENGPEFCAIERMSCGPDPQWPLAVISTPSNIRMSAMLELKATDDSGNPAAGVSFTLINAKNGASAALGTTNAQGVLVKEGLQYGDYTLQATVPAGFEPLPAQKIKLTTASNSKNTIQTTLKKIVVSTPASNDLPDSTDSQPEDPNKDQDLSD